LAKNLAGNELLLPNFWWKIKDGKPDFTSGSTNGNTVSISLISKVVKEVMKKTDKLLVDLSCGFKFTLSSFGVIQDEMSNVEPGYSFVSHHGNQSKISKARNEYFQQLKSSLAVVRNGNEEWRMNKFQGIYFKTKSKSLLNKHTRMDGIIKLIP
jgi:hypothetical protein